MCLPGYTGTKCQTLVSFFDCGCRNGGSCSLDAAYCSCPPGFYGRRCDVELDDDFCRRADAVDIDVILCRVWRERGYCSFAYSYDYVPVPVFCAATCELCQRGNQSDATKDSMLVAVKKRLSE